jgi:hypothetical protein
MDGDDPHIHVDVKLHGDVAVRNLLAGTFGLVADSPAVVTTGCGRQVPPAMTSVLPEKVTCLPCREFAHRRHLTLADQLDSLGRMAGSPLTADQAAEVASRHRATARRFADGH